MSKRKLTSRSGMVLVITLLFITAFVLTSGCAAQKDLNFKKSDKKSGPAGMESVNVKGGDKTDKVIIKMSPDSNYEYTLYKWLDPARVVVDLNGVAPGDVPGTIPVANGLVKDIEVKSLDEKDKVRVIISLTKSVDYSAEKDGDDSLIVSLDKESVSQISPPKSNSGVVLVEEGDSLHIVNETGSGKGEDAWVWSGPQPVEDRESASSESKGEKEAAENTGPATPAQNLKGISIKDEGDLARVELGMDGTVADYSAFTLQGPPRLVVDLWGMKNGSKTHRKNINQQGIMRVRIGEHPDKLRLVFDANSSMPNFRFDKENNHLIVTFSKTVNVSATPEISATAETETAGILTSGTEAAGNKNTTGKDTTKKAETKDGWSVMSVAQNDEWGGLDQGESTNESGDQWGGPTPSETGAEEEAETESTEDVDSGNVPKPSESFDWGDKPQPPIVKGPGKPGIAYIDKVEFKYNEQASTISIHADRPIRREQWELHNNIDENVTEKVVTIFLYDAQLAEDQQKTFDTSEFFSPIDMFSVYQRPGEAHANEVAVVIVLNSWAASKWNQYGHSLVLKFENTPGSLGIGGQPTQGSIGPQGEEFTGGGGSGYGPGPGESEQYTGGLVNLNFKGVDIKEVLAVLAESSGMNFVVDENVKATVTIRLDNVPWDQALDIILESYDLEKKQTGNILRIAPEGEFSREQREKFREMEEKRKYEELEIKIIPVNYLDAQRLRQVVSQVLTQGRGKVQIDKRTNSMVVMDRPEVLQMVTELIRRLDKPTKQVLIEVRMVEATVAVTREIGVRWGADMDIGPHTGTPTGMQFPNEMQVGGAVLGGAENAAINADAMSSGGGAIGLSVGHLTNAVDLDVMLRALEAKEKVKIISSPRIITLTDEQASIQQGISIPYPPPSTMGAGGVGWQFVEASLKLDVTPHVAQDDSITLEIEAQNNEPVTVAGSERPGVSTKEAKTTILLMNGETGVIGGIFKLTDRNPTTQVPFLGNLPYIGRMFKYEQSESRNEELLIFLTPQIVEGGVPTDGRDDDTSPIKVGS